MKVVKKQLKWAKNAKSTLLFSKNKSDFKTGNE